jgi:hypothetical protein
LFHRAVVVCESDSDCRFYAAVLEELPGLAQGLASEVLFTHCGGKQRIATVVSALRELGVPVRVIADFDVFRDEAEFSNIVTSLGGPAEVFATNARVVRTAVDASSQYPTTAFAKEEIAKILASAPNRLNRDAAEALRSVVRAEGGWRAVKRGGVHALPQGDASSAAKHLISQLHEVGLHVVPVGELERWAPDIPDHGPAWCTNALTHGRQRDAESREFVRDLARSIGLSVSASG